MEVVVSGDEVRVGPRFSVAFQRTLRIPEDGKEYPLPPGLGRLPVHRVGDFRGRLPSRWADDELFIPLYQREALWLAFDGAWWKPNAVQVGVGGVNAVSGTGWGEELVPSPQNYLVCPDQPWLDGINAGDGFVRQFVAVPLGEGRTVEGQVTGREERGGIQLRVFEPRPGRFPDEPPTQGQDAGAAGMPQRSASLGLGAGGRIRQRIYPDPYGVEAWDPAAAEVACHILNADEYLGATGRRPPPSPITAETYAEWGLPWFDLYDEGVGDVPGPEALSGLEPAGADEADPSVAVDPEHVRKIRRSGE
ncbi:MAG: hypothetical protein ACRDJ4_12070 [Actinomycetota bacterium]